MSNPISTVDELVDAFGGTGEFAQWLDVGPSTVSNWKALGYIPNGYHLRIYLEATDRDLPLAPALFGFKRWPASMEGARPLARRRAEARA